MARTHPNARIAGCSRKRIFARESVQGWGELTLRHLWLGIRVWTNLVAEIPSKSSVLKINFRQIKDVNGISKMEYSEQKIPISPYKRNIK